MTDTAWQVPTVDIVGTTEIAARCYVEPITVRAWRTRGQLPAPDGRVGGTDWWHWERVVSLSPMVARYQAEARLAAAQAESADATPEPTP